MHAGRSMGERLQAALERAFTFRLDGCAAAMQQCGQAAGTTAASQIAVPLYCGTMVTCALLPTGPHAARLTRWRRS